MRLSQVTGEVQLDRQTGRGFEGAFANLPITQGGVLRTGNGVAEVEFEDNSSLRLTPQSTVAFPVLSLGPDGTRSSTVHVLQGAVYASLTKGKQNNVNLTFGKETLALGPGSHVELALNGTQPRLDVMDGTVQAVNGATTTTVGRKKALLFDPANSAAPTLVSSNEKGQYDAWDKQAVEYHERMAPSGGSYAGVPYAYGLADMNYYGELRLHRRLRHDVASLSHQRQLEPLRQRRLGLLSRRRLLLGLPLSVGLDGLSLRHLELLPGSRLGLAARQSMERPAEHGTCATAQCPEHPQAPDSQAAPSWPNHDSLSIRSRW